MANPVDYTQVLHQKHLLKNVLNFLPDETVVDDLDSLVWVDREFQSEVTKERRRRIQHFLTYGAAAYREGYKPDEELLTYILGDQDNWKTSKYAMTLVARTFSGAKHDPNGPYRFENLYPELPPDTEVKPAFRKVLQWWQWMCNNNRDIAIKVDLLSFFLFAGENWKRLNQRQHHELALPQIGTVVDNLSVDGGNLSMQALFSLDLIQAYKQFNHHEVTFTLLFSHHSIKFSIDRYTDTFEEFKYRDGNDHQLMDKFRIDKNDTAVWAHACVDELIAKLSMRSFRFISWQISWWHARHVTTFSRRTDEDEFASDKKYLMF